MTERISLATIRRGSAVEMVDDAIQKIMENIVDPNTDATAKRKVTLTLSFVPTNERDSAAVGISVRSSLAPQAAVETTAFISHTRDGVACVEYDPNQIGLFEEPDAPNVETFPASNTEGGAE